MELHWISGFQKVLGILAGSAGLVQGLRMEGREPKEQGVASPVCTKRSCPTFTFCYCVKTAERKQVWRPLRGTTSTSLPVPALDDLAFYSGGWSCAPVTPGQSGQCIWAEERAHFFHVIGGSRLFLAGPQSWKLTQRG